MANDQSNAKVACTRDVSSDESLAQAVVTAVAAISGADPAPTAASDAEPLEPLYTVIDPEALDSIFGPAGSGGDRAGGKITFSYHGCEVTIHGENRITVTRPEAPTGEAAN